MREDLEALSRRAGGGDLSAARRLVAALEARAPQTKTRARAHAITPLLNDDLYDLNVVTFSIPANFDYGPGRRRSRVKVRRVRVAGAEDRLGVEIEDPISAEAEERLRGDRSWPNRVDGLRPVDIAWILARLCDSDPSLADSFAEFRAWRPRGKV